MARAVADGTDYQALATGLTYARRVTWTYTDRALVFASPYGLVVADASDLVPTWVIELPERTSQLYSRAIGLSAHEPDIVVAVFENGVVCAIDCQKRRVNRLVRIESPEPLVAAAPGIDGGCVFVVSRTGRLWQIDISPFRVTELRVFLPETTTAIAALSDSQLIGGTRDGRLFRADFESGELFWIGDQEGFVSQVLPVVKHRVVLVVLDGGETKEFRYRTIVRAFRLSSGLEPLWVHLSEHPQNLGGPARIDTSPNGDWVALPDGVYETVSGKRKFAWARAWYLERSSQVPARGGSRSGPACAMVRLTAWSHGGDTVCVGSDSLAGSWVKLVGFPEGKLLAALPTGFGWFWRLSLASSPNSSLVGISWRSPAGAFDGVCESDDASYERWWFVDFKKPMPLVRVCARNGNLGRLLFMPCGNQVAIWWTETERLVRTGSEPGTVATRVLLRAMDPFEGRDLLHLSLTVQGLVERVVHLGNRLDHFLLYRIFRHREEPSLVGAEWVLYDTSTRQPRGRWPRGWSWLRCLPQAGLEVFWKSTDYGWSADPRCALAVLRIPTLEMVCALEDVPPVFGVYAPDASRVRVASSSRIWGVQGVLLWTSRGPEGLVRRLPSNPCYIEWLTADRLLVSWEDATRGYAVVGELLELKDAGGSRVVARIGGSFYGESYHPIAGGQLVVTLQEGRLAVYCGRHGDYLGSFWPLPGGEWAITDRLGGRTLSSPHAAKWFRIEFSWPLRGERFRPEPSKAMRPARLECPRCGSAR